MQSTRGSYYSQVVNEYQSDQRIENFLELLTTCMPNLIYHILPTALQVLKLANCFINVFVDKIDTIHRDDLVERCPQDSLVYEDTPVRSSSLDFFADVPIDDLFSMARWQRGFLLYLMGRICLRRWAVERRVIFWTSCMLTLPGILLEQCSITTGTVLLSLLLLLLLIALYPLYR